MMQKTLQALKRILAAVMILMLLPVCAVAEGTMDLSVTPGLNKDWYNFLLIGTDTRSDEANAGRSDTIIICSVNLTTVEVKLTSLTRDMWVNIPGKRMDKLNAAHTYGGPELLIKTINENFQMNIEDYVSVNFYGVIDIVDALGGVDVEISKEEAGEINRRVNEQFRYADVETLRSGVAHMAGVQALTFARIRSLDSDFGRSGRQRRVLAAMLQKAKGASITQLWGFANSCLDHVTTNISIPRIISMAASLLSGGMDSFGELSLPSSGNYYYSSSDGISKVMYDQTQVTDELHLFIYGK